MNTDENGEEVGIERTDSFAHTDEGSYSQAISYMHP